jgi:hypothetical protein
LPRVAHLRLCSTLPTLLRRSGPDCVVAGVHAPSLEHAPHADSSGAHTQSHSLSTPPLRP